MIKIDKATLGKAKTPVIAVQSPFHPDWAKNAKNLGGQWDAAAGKWVFDRRDEDRVRVLCRQIYGTDGSPADAKDLVTIKITATKEHQECGGGIFFAGRCLAQAYGRDSGAKLASGVILLEGKATSGGSVKNWLTAIYKGTVLEVRDLPKAAIPDEPDGWEVEFIHPDIKPPQVNCVRLQVTVNSPITLDTEGSLKAAISEEAVYQVIVALLRSQINGMNESLPAGWSLSLSE